MSSLCHISAVDLWYAWLAENNFAPFLQKPAASSEASARLAAPADATRVPEGELLPETPRDDCPGLRRCFRAAHFWLLRSVGSLKATSEGLYGGLCHACRLGHGTFVAFAVR